MLLQKSAASSRRFIERLWKQLQAVSPQEEGCVSTPTHTDLKQGDALSLQPWMRHLDVYSLKPGRFPCSDLKQFQEMYCHPSAFHKNMVVNLLRGNDTGGKRVDQNLGKTDIARRHDPNRWDQNRSKTADQSASTITWASAYAHCNHQLRHTHRHHDSSKTDHKSKKWAVAQFLWVLR